MHPTRNLTLFSLALLALCAFTGQAFAGNTVAGLCAASGTHFTTIQAAVNAVTPGGKVSVCPGTYNEQVTINKNLTLTGIVDAADSTGAAVVLPPNGGLAQNGTDIFGNPVAAQIFVSNATVTIQDITVDASGNNLAGCGAPTLEGIYYQNSSGTITHNAVRNQYQTDFVDYGGCQNGLAINVEATASGNTVTVSNNSVRAYQKNGITATGAGTGAGSPGPAVTISGNFIVGLAATQQNWPGGAAENGVQVGFGATGSVTSNTVNDNIWFADNSSQPFNAASGILVFSSSGINISNNNVGSAQFGITTDSDSPNSTFCNGVPCGPADNTTIVSNKVSGTQIFDAIDLCSNTNTVTSNFVYGTAESGVHADSSCTGASASNSIQKNTINEACAAILEGTGSTGTILSGNAYLNVTNTVIIADSCTPPAGPTKKGTSSAKHNSVRPSPYMPARK